MKIKFSEYKNPFVHCLQTWQFADSPIFQVYGKKKSWQSYTCLPSIVYRQKSKSQEIIQDDNVVGKHTQRKIIPAEPKVPRHLSEAQYTLEWEAQWMHSSHAYSVDSDPHGQETEVTYAK
jgi:hypothetical protein